jgi:predicted AlkP superfamily pyrophosphatase or phosphodiesterase
MLRYRFPALLLPALLLPALLAPQYRPRPASRKLLVICISGLDERFLGEPPSRVKIPNIRKLIRQAAIAGGVVGVAPSNTPASQTSLVTGLRPSDNGVLSYDESSAAVKTMSLWRAAAKDGLKAATVFWPATAGAEVAFDFPATAPGPGSQDVSFDSVARLATPPGTIDRIEKQSPGFQKELWDDASAARAATYLLETAAPDLLLLQLTDVDDEQRHTGAISIYARDALENDDDLIGQMLAKAPQGMIIALVSGHGFENENYLVRPRVLLSEGRRSSAAIPVEVKYGLIGTSDPAVAERLRRLMTEGRRHGIAREVPMAEVEDKAPGLRNWVAAFDTLPNYVATEDNVGPALGPGSHLGVEGLWPSRPGYRSVFAIAGEGIRPKNLGEIDLLQIAPTLADVIGVKLPRAKEPSLWPVIAQ